MQSDQASHLDTQWRRRAGVLGATARSNLRLGALGWEIMVASWAVHFVAAWFGIGLLLAKRRRHASK
jgi:hypothetical protein